MFAIQARHPQIEDPPAMIFSIPVFLGRCLLIFLLSVLFWGCASIGPGSDRSQKFHVGIWLNREIMKEGEEAISTFLNDAAARGITAVYPNFWFQGHTIYPGSEYADQHPEFAGWNPLEVVIREADRLGIEVHPWAEYGFFTHLDFTDSQEDTGYILEANPGWITESREGRVSLHYPQRDFSHYSLNPAHPGARQFLRDVMLEAVRLHPEVAGLHLDRIRYQRSDFSYDPFSLAAFKAEHGFNPLQIGPDPEQQALWERWRIEHINTFMLEMSREFQAEFPGKILSAAVVPPYRMGDKFQRWDEMVSRGYLHVPIPRVYGSFELVQREIDRSLALLPTGSKLYAGLDLGSLDFAEVTRAVDYVRSRGVAGIVLWDDREFREKETIRFDAR